MKDQSTTETPSHGERWTGMAWIRNSFQAGSVPRRTVAIAVMFLGCAFLRTLIALLLALCFIAGALGSIALVALLVRPFELYFPAFEVPAAILACALAGSLWILGGLRIARHLIRSDTKAWRISRSNESGLTAYESWLRRARRWSLCVPSFIALVTVLFLPEIWGSSSHMFHHNAQRLDRYRVQIPLTWVILGGSIKSETGFSYVAAFVGKGIARDWLVIPRLSSVSFSTQRIYGLRDRTQNVKIFSTRTLWVGSTTLTCQEYLPNEMHYSLPPDGDFRFVDCSSSDGVFKASFYGERLEIPSFYEMLHSVRPTE